MLAETEAAPSFHISEWLLPSRTMRRRAWPPLVGLGYIAAIWMLGGLRPDHVMIGLLGCLDLYNEKSRALLRDFFPCILTGVVYDSMRYFYWQGIAGHVHVEGPYNFDKALFGFGGKTLNEQFAIHHWAWADLAAGFGYLTFAAEFLLIAFFLFVRGRHETVQQMAWCFFLVNLLGFITYFVFPVAPPWYVAQYGLGPARMDVHPDPGAAHRFDVLLGTHLFDQMYGRGVDVYGAYPSLHVAYPLMAVLFSFGERSLRWFRAPAIAFLGLLAFAAVYLQHHYVTDELLGWSFTLIVFFAIRQWSASRASAAQPGASGSVEASASRSAAS